MTIRSLIRAAALTVTGLLAACQAAPGSVTPMGQFFAGDNGTDAVGPFDQGFAQAVSDPQDTIIVIYNHGTDWGGQFQDCQPGTMPRFIRNWGTTGIAGHDVAVFYLCTQVVEKRFVMGRQRSEENEALLDRLIALGVPPGHIFILGHSGGASTALLTAQRAPGKFNAAVVSAPGYGFAYLEEEGESGIWMDVEYDKWRGRLAGADDMTALVYVYDGDIYAPPKDALFLRDHPKVDVIQIHAPDGANVLCKDQAQPHFYWWSACFKSEQVDVIESYIQDKLNGAAYAEAS